MEYHILPNGIPWHLAAWYTCIWRVQSLLWLMQTRWICTREHIRLARELGMLSREPEECPTSDEAQND
jgi:hypothetical protein